MKSSSVRELHLKTSEIVRQVVAGESFIIEKRGVPVAEIRPISERPKARMPDREVLIMSGPETMDSGLILRAEQDLRLYFDTAYLGKCYWNEPDGRLVRELARRADGLYSSAICIAELACLAHRKVREGPITTVDAVTRRDLFLDDVNSGVITTLPVTDLLLRRVEAITRTPAACMFFTDFRRAPFGYSSRFRFP
jgi:antitoxin (DNA-binding transcriptional repressor) of toxin-antitoxin stability system